MSITHRPGDKVFAKIKGFSNWPARINPLPPDVQIPKGKLPVFFYGTYQVSFVPPKNIVPYEKFKDKWGKPKPNPQFMAAMEEIETNPGIFMLGEDPQAEAFLLQFYDFKPKHSSTGGRSRKIPEKEKFDHSSDDMSSMSDTIDPHVQQKPHRSKNSKRAKVRPDLSPKNIAKSVKITTRAREHMSETSSEFSSALSKQDSAEIMDDDVVSEDDAVTKLPRNPGTSDGEDESRSVSITHSNDHTDALSVHEIDYESREARRLAKRQKKAEKRALKAARREAKRLVKKQERAEKLARKEAKRELKRLHRLKKQQQISASDYPNEEVSGDPVMMMTPSPNLDWSMPTGINPALVEGLSPSLDVHIEAELQQSDVTPLSDRPTSPLRLDDYPAVECYDDLTMIQEFAGSGHGASALSPLPSDETLFPTEQHQDEKSTLVYGSKRTLNETEFDDAKHEFGESDHALPSKRSKLDAQRSHPSNQITLVSKTTESDHSEDDINGNNSGTQINLPTVKTHRSRTRLLSDSSGDEHTHKSKQAESSLDEVHETTMILRKRIDNKNERLSDANNSTDTSLRDNPRSSPDCKPVKLNSTPHGNHVRKDASVGRHRKQSLKRNVQLSSSHPTRSSEKPDRNESSHKDGTPRNHGKSRSPNPDHDNSPGSSSVVSRLCHLCRELKASLVRGHENFKLAVSHLTQLTTVPARLPELAQAWDLMDCIKKCRRYKLSVEVREAAEKTLKYFHSIQSMATKEELAQTQALITAHQQKQSSAKEIANDPKLSTNSVKPANHTDPTTSVNTSITSTVPSTVVKSPSEPPIPPATESGFLEHQNSPREVHPPTTSSDDNYNSISADLNAKMDDVLSRIRAAEQRLAAASASTTFINRSMSTHISDKSYGDGHTIRASAVAAAAANMRDEEDVETVVSRVEQVAAYEAAAASKVSFSVTSTSENSLGLSSPPPPPPPFPAKSTESRSQTPISSVDLDLDSRIQRLITRPIASLTEAPPPPPPPLVPQRQNVDNGHATHLPAALLARRAAIATKLASTKASNENADSNASKSSNSLKDGCKDDDEIYDLLGV